MSKDRDKGKTVTICGGNKTYDGTKCIVKSTSSYPSSTSRGGEESKGGQWGYSGSNSGQNTSNTRYGDNDYLIDLYKKGLLDEHINKIEQSKNIPSELIPYYSSHSGKVIGWLEHQNNTLNLNFNIAGKDLDMSNKQITDENMLFFCQKMASFTFHFDNLIISNNLMTNLSVQYLFNATLTSPTNRTITPIMESVAKISRRKVRELRES